MVDRIRERERMRRLLDAQSREGRAPWPQTEEGRRERLREIGRELLERIEHSSEDEEEEGPEAEPDERSLMLLDALSQVFSPDEFRSLFHRAPPTEEELRWSPRGAPPQD